MHLLESHRLRSVFSTWTALALLRPVVFLRRMASYRHRPLHALSLLPTLALFYQFLTRLNVIRCLLGLGLSAFSGIRRREDFSISGDANSSRRPRALPTSSKHPTLGHRGRDHRSPIPSKLCDATHTPQSPLLPTVTSLTMPSRHCFTIADNVLVSQT